MRKAYVVVEKEDQKLNILCVEPNNTAIAAMAVAVERDDDYEYRKIKASEVIDHVRDCIISWGKRCQTLKDFVETVAHAISIVEVDGDEEAAVADVFASLNLEEFREYFKISFQVPEVIACIPARYEF